MGTDATRLLHDEFVIEITDRSVERNRFCLESVFVEMDGNVQQTSRIQKGSRTLFGTVQIREGSEFGSLGRIQSRTLQGSQTQTATERRGIRVEPVIIEFEFEFEFEF